MLLIWISKLAFDFKDHIGRDLFELFKHRRFCTFKIPNAGKYYILHKYVRNHENWSEKAFKCIAKMYHVLDQWRLCIYSHIWFRKIMALNTIPGVFTGLEYWMFPIIYVAFFLDATLTLLISVYCKHWVCCFSFKIHFWRKK